MKRVFLLALLILLIVALFGCGEEHTTTASTNENGASSSTNSATPDPTTQPTTTHNPLDISDDKAVANITASRLYILGQSYDIVSATVAERILNENGDQLTFIFDVSAENEKATATTQMYVQYFYDSYMDVTTVGVGVDESYGHIVVPKAAPTSEEMDEFEGWELVEYQENLENGRYIATLQNVEHYKNYTKTEKNVVTFEFDPYELAWENTDQEEMPAVYDWNIEGAWSTRYFNNQFFSQNEFENVEIVISEMTAETMNILINWPEEGGVLVDQMVEYTNPYGTVKLTLRIPNPSGSQDTYQLCFGANDIWITDGATFYSYTAYFLREEEIPAIPYVTPDDSDFRYTLNEEDKTAIIRSYVGNETYLWIPDKIDGEYTVVGIDEEAFAYNNALAIHIPETVTSIGDYAFYSCGFYVFNMPSGLTHIGDYAFSECYNLYQILLPDTLETIGEYAFCFSELTSIEIPEKVLSVPVGLCYGCDNLEDIKLHDKVERIGKLAFYYCHNVISVEIPASVKVIEESAFEECQYLKECVFHDGIEEIAYQAFAYTQIENIILPDTLTKIGELAFCGVQNVKYLKISSGLKELSAYCFFSTGFEQSTLFIPEGIEVIGEGAFCNWQALTKIALPTTLKEIDTYAFDGCYRLTTMYYAGSAAEWEKVNLNNCEIIIEANKKWNSTGDLDKMEP